MRNLLFFPLLFALLLFGCSKDNLVVEPQVNNLDPDLAHIMVRVTVETEASESNGCCTKGRCDVGVDATIRIFPDGARSAPSEVALNQLRTDENGFVVFENLPLQDYLMTVDSEFEDVEQLVKPRTGQLTRVFVRF